MLLKESTTPVYLFCYELDSSKVFLRHSCALHFLMKSNKAWYIYDRVLCTRWCQPAKIRQRWKHQHWIKWAYIALWVSTRESTSVWRKSTNHKPLFSSPGYSGLLFPLFSPIRHRSSYSTWPLAGFPSMPFIETGISSIWRLKVSVLKRVVRGMANTL